MTSCILNVSMSIGKDLLDHPCCLSGSSSDLLILMIISLGNAQCLSTNFLMNVRQMKLLSYWVRTSTSEPSQLPSLTNHDSWWRQMSEIILQQWASHKELESIVSRLNHATMVMPLSRYFLGHLRRLISNHKTCKHIRLTKDVVLALFNATIFFNHELPKSEAIEIAQKTENKEEGTVK